MTKAEIVKDINWQEIPRESHEELLLAIRIGECVKTLPFTMPEEVNAYKIPLVTNEIYKAEIPAEIPGRRILEFERITLFSLNGQQVIRAFRRTS